MTTEDLRIRRTRPLISPAILAEEIPQTPSAETFVRDTRRQIVDIVQGRDQRLLIITGPCSIHDPVAALEYAERLRPIADRVAEQALLVMRVYFEKPRTTVGWKGYINDPFLDQSYRVNEGLRRARRLLADIIEIGVPTATEFLDTTFGQYYADLICWGAIGARTVESQIHRQLASGLSMPVGIKNRRDGDVQVAVDAMVTAKRPHLFPSLTREGAPALLETSGNRDCHLVLRGGTRPNCDTSSIAAASELLDEAGLSTGILVDCSHANGGGIPARQAQIAREVVEARDRTPRLAGLMLESHLVEGRQNPNGSLTFGQSITDPCLGFEQTQALIESLAARLRQTSRPAEIAKESALPT